MKSPSKRQRVFQTDYVFWSIALAVYATVEMEPEQFLTVIPR
jgi:hypothetical protein